MYKLFIAVAALVMCSNSFADSPDIVVSTESSYITTMDTVNKHQINAVITIQQKIDLDAGRIKPLRLFLWVRNMPKEKVRIYIV